MRWHEGGTEVDAPETRYVRSGDASIASSVTGDGPIDVVHLPGFISHVEILWDYEPSARFLRRLASFSRLILVDRRGTGLSGPNAKYALEHFYRRPTPGRSLGRCACPTLVPHRTADPAQSVEGGRYIAEHIPGATLVGLPGEEWFTFGDDQDALADAVEEFLTGTKRLPDADRVLATVLFTDIAGSTEKAAELGDSAWRALRVAHHDRVRRLLETHRGREVDTAGDGFFATFDGPARCGAPLPSPRRLGRWASRSVRDVTRGRSS